MPHALRGCSLVIVLIAAACSSRRRTEAPLPPIDPTRMPHEKHVLMPCSGCHRSAARPGADDHRPCDDGACHKKEFLGPPNLFCKVCHKDVTTGPLAAPLRPYPSTDDAWQSLPPLFSHASHMDAARMERSVGFHIGCPDCHVDSNNARARPGHPVCARCHAAEVGLAKAPRMEDCGGCHQKGAQQRVRSRLIRDDLRAFDHERHRTDRRNQTIRCDACHDRSAGSRAHADHAAPRIESCVGCHDDANRTPYAMRMRICETCHLARASTLTVIAPRSHLPASERPLDHTIAFRRDHAEAAARDAARCATCHTQMSGNAKQTCDDCHQTMLPSDHRITWRELDHGPEAAATRNRCATCHVVEFCTACHAQRPRSHGLVGTFEREHARLARTNVRACLTCHNADAGGGFDGTCRRPGCHQ